MFLRSADRIEKVDQIMLRLAISFMFLLLLGLVESQRLLIIEKRKRN